MNADARLTRLLALYGLEIARHIRRLVRDDDVAQDLLQDTLLRAHRSLASSAPAANERAWLYRIATNTSLNWLRARGRERRMLERAARETDHVAAPAAEDDDRRTALWQRVAALPERQRVALTLRIADELDYAAIGERMACSAETARANVYQAVKKLRLGGIA